MHNVNIIPYITYPIECTPSITLDKQTTKAIIVYIIDLKSGSFISSPFSKRSA